jgi:putative flippase GtrA
MRGVNRSSVFACSHPGGVWKFLRFACVGSIATITYLIISLGLSDSSFRLAPWIGSFVGFAVAFVVSYFGHLLFTYGAEPDHIFYGPRFALANLSLIIVFSSFSQVFASSSLGHVWANVLVAGLFPACSFLLHAFWSFAPRRRN